MDSARTPTMPCFLPTPFGYDDDSRILQSSSATRYKKTLKIIKRGNLIGVSPHPASRLAIRSFSIGFEAPPIGRPDGVDATLAGRDFADRERERSGSICPMRMIDVNVSENGQGRRRGFVSPLGA